MAENKTIPTAESVDDFLGRIQDIPVRQDCYAILDLMESVSQSKPVMWGSSIIGFGAYHYVYESGREGDMPILGFSPRKKNLTFYFMGGLDPLEDELSELGKYQRGKGCLYIKALKDVDTGVLSRMLSKVYENAKNK